MNQEEKINEILNTVFEPNAENPLWVCVQLSCDLETLKNITRIVWNAAIDAAAESAKVECDESGLAEYCEIDKQSITDLKFKP